MRVSGPRLLASLARWLDALACVAACLPARRLPACLPACPPACPPACLLPPPVMLVPPCPCLRPCPCPSPGQAVEHYRRHFPDAFRLPEQLAAKEEGAVFRVAFMPRTKLRSIVNVKEAAKVGGWADGWVTGRLRAQLAVALGRHGIDGVSAGIQVPRWRLLDSPCIQAASLCQHCVHHLRCFWLLESHQSAPHAPVCVLSHVCVERRNARNGCHLPTPNTSACCGLARAVWLLGSEQQVRPPSLDCSQSPANLGHLPLPCTAALPLYCPALHCTALQERGLRAAP